MIMDLMCVIITLDIIKLESFSVIEEMLPVPGCDKIPVINTCNVTWCGAAWQASLLCFAVCACLLYSKILTIRIRTVEREHERCIGLKFIMNKKRDVLLPHTFCCHGFYSAVNGIS